MPHLANTELTVELLDPASDQARLGPRFCWGGYIWQVQDRLVGPLLAGPEWPHPTPSPFNGQGLPESFRHSTMTGQPLLWEGPTGLAPGAGALTRDAQGTVTVSAPCTWHTELSETRASYRTAQTVGNWSYALERVIELKGRRLSSSSTLANQADTPLVLEWFVHPFFALQADGKSSFKLPVGTQLADNPGYRLRDNELSFRRAFVGQHDGHLVQLALPPDQPFSAEVSHPLLSGLGFAVDFAPFQCVFWANGHTVSIEPYLSLQIPPGETRTWTLCYEFGSPKSEHVRG